MSLINIYNDLSNDELDILDEVIGDKVHSYIRLQNVMVSNGTRPWMAILSEHLRNNDKHIMIKSSRYYYKQSDLDYYWPTNLESHTLASPFDRTGAAAEYEILFIDTSTGTKIYEYAAALCKQSDCYIDRPSLAVTLTEDKSHKVKIIHSANTVYILSNQFSEEFVEKCLALFPFLFDLKDLQKDEDVMGVCKAVATNSPVKPYFEKLFKSLKEIREQRKIELIKTALNARLTQQINSTQRSIRDKQEDIERLLNKLPELYKELEGLQAKEMGYLAKSAVKTEEVQELLDFTNNNEYIKNVSVIQRSTYGGYVDNLLVTIQAPITIYEPEPLEAYIDNILSTTISPESNKGRILLAFKRIFIEEELEMICETKVAINLADININASKGSLGYGTSDYDKMIQPHLILYNCWGDNKNEIINSLKDGDLIGALNLILIASQNINFTDAQVLRNWLDTLVASNHLYNLKTCVSKIDGKLWSLRDIIEQIEKEELDQQLLEAQKPDLVDTIEEFVEEEDL